MRWVTALALAMGLCRLAFSDEPPGPVPDRGWGARSIGSPQDGRLAHGRRIRETPFLKILAAAAPRGRQFGTEELVGAIARAAEAVSRAFPGSVLRVADLSARGGGEVHMHASHESGRDADVAFYLNDASGADALPPRFVKIGPEGRSEDGAVVFDDTRNWAFVEALLSDRRASVSHVFVAAPLRERLLARAREAGAPARIIARAAAILSQPRGSFPHDNHFHVRVACAREDEPECTERRAPSFSGPRPPPRPAGGRAGRRARPRAGRG